MVDLPRLRQTRALGAVIGDAFSILFSDLPVLAKTVAPAVLVSVAGALIIYGLGDDEALTTIALYIELPILLIAFQLVSAAVIARLDARDHGRELESGDALDERRAFRDTIAQEPGVTQHLSPTELDAIFDYTYYTREVDKSFARLGLIKG